MYSKRVQAALDKAGVKAGDFIRITTKDFSCEGVLMPRIEFGDPECVVLKLLNGYNTGVKFRQGMRVQRVRAGGQRARLGSRPVKRLVFDKSKPPVSLVVTGGTIGSRVEYHTGGVVALMSPEEVLSVVPELADFVNLRHIHRPFTKMSEDMDYRDWQKLAQLAAKQLNAGDAGVIITHGTDTLHYTAAALSFMLPKLSKPVIVTGAQRSSDRGSTDAAMNLLCSAYVAGYSDFAEVGVCMHGTTNDDYCLFSRGTKVRKMHTSRRDTFRPINDLPLAKVWPAGKIETVNPAYRRREEGEVVADTKFEPRLALVKAYPGSEPGVLEYLAGRGVRGFVVEGTGFGHVPTNAEKSWIPAIKNLVKDGLPVVVASQAFYGKTNAFVYENLRVLFGEAGAIPAQDMLPETAYVKLGWVLGREKDLDKIRTMMTTSLVGEISKRSLPQTFLY